MRPSRTFAAACVQFVEVNSHLRSLRDIAARLQHVCQYIGGLDLTRVHSGAVQPIVADLQKRGVKNRTVNAYLQDVRRVLNQAAGEWIDEHGLTWLHAAPKIKMLPLTDQRKPAPLSYDEQQRLFSELAPHLQRMALFAVNTGAREAEVCGLMWDWWQDRHGLFLLPDTATKMQRERVIVCNSVALSVLGPPKRGGHVFQLNGKRVTKMNNSGWKAARVRSGVNVRVHDLRHTFAGRLRAAGVGLHTIAELLGHVSGGSLSVTLHYSAAQLSELRDAVELLVTQKPDVLLRRVK